MPYSSRFSLLSNTVIAGQLPLAARYVLHLRFKTADPGLSRAVVCLGEGVPDAAQSTLPEFIHIFSPTTLYQEEVEPHPGTPYALGILQGLCSTLAHSPGSSHTFVGLETVSDDALGAALVPGEFSRMVGEGSHVTDRSTRLLAAVRSEYDRYRTYTTYQPLSTFERVNHYSRLSDDGLRASTLQQFIADSPQWELETTPPLFPLPRGMHYPRR